MYQTARRNIPEAGYLCIRRCEYVRPHEQLHFDAKNKQLPLLSYGENGHKPFLQMDVVSCLIMSLVLLKFLFYFCAQIIFISLYSILCAYICTSQCRQRHAGNAHKVHVDRMKRSMYSDRDASAPLPPTTMRSAGDLYDFQL